MRHTVTISALVALTTAVLTVFSIEFSGLRPDVSSAQDSGIPTGEAAGEIKGDIDCNLGIEAVDALKLLQDIAAFDYIQNDPCTEVGALIPAGEPIPGPQGPQGPEGPQGEQGPAGISDLTFVTNTATVVGSTVIGQSVKAECPAGSKVLGGGGVFNSLFVPNYYLSVSYPFEENKWWVGFQAEAGNYIPEGTELIAHAICAMVEE